MQRRTKEFREERIFEEPKKDRTGWFFIIGLIVSLIGYIIYDFHINTYKITQTGRKILLGSDYPYQFIGLVVIVVGLISISIAVIKIVYSRFR